MCLPKSKRDPRNVAPGRQIEEMDVRRNFGTPRSPGFRGGALHLVRRLVKWAVSEQNLHSGLFSIHSSRWGGETCLYHAGADLEYIMRFW